MYYYCSNCKNTFDDPKIEIETHKYSDFDVAVDEYMLCPYCEENTVEEMEKCDCGLWMIVNSEYCDVCKEVIKEHITELVEYLETSETKLIDYISEL